VKKVILTEKLSSGTLSNDELLLVSRRMNAIVNDRDNKSMRWGELLFESNKLDSKAWDSKYKGKLITDGSVTIWLDSKNKE
jgi:hypothetical protein